MPYNMYTLLCLQAMRLTLTPFTQRSPIATHSIGSNYFGRYPCRNALTGSPCSHLLRHIQPPLKQHNVDVQFTQTSFLTLRKGSKIYAIGADGTLLLTLRPSASSCLPFPCLLPPCCFCWLGMCSWLLSACEGTGCLRGRYLRLGSGCFELSRPALDVPSAPGDMHL